LPFCRQAIDQPDLAAGFRRHIGPVHAVDDPRQNKSDIGRIQQRPIEQLNIVGWPDADGLTRMIRLLPRYIPTELAVDRLAHGNHGRSRKQAGVGYGSLGRSVQ